ncbi:hypothetical protein FQR65_LT08286 [Abscondita terminalis]|nr:hypothetical protein FQR65_LT08286 [Abscondita terminalis]
MTLKEHNEQILKIRKKLYYLNKKLLKSGIHLSELRLTASQSLDTQKPSLLNRIFIISTLIILTLSIFYQCGIFETILNYFLGIRCIIPNNYFVWEATRPISDCQFCTNVTEPLILLNVTREEFSKYAFSSKPIVIKNALHHWPAVTVFTFDFFKSLYDNIHDAYRSVDEECQFLHFKSNFISLRDVFSMSEDRVKNQPGEASWYVGWGNCDPTVLTEMRKHYPKPHFLPEDSEVSAKEYVFMGYDAGATMHLDFINRLMWQAQLQGTKTWYLKPSPECENVCHSISFLAEPGDAVLIDTRVWYHGTTIKPVKTLESVIQCSQVNLGARLDKSTKRNECLLSTQSDGSIIKSPESGLKQKFVNKVKSWSMKDKLTQNDLPSTSNKPDFQMAVLTTTIENLNSGNTFSEENDDQPEVFKAKDSLENILVAKTDKCIDESKSGSLRDAHYSEILFPNSILTINNATHSLVKELTWDPWNKLGRKNKKEKRRKEKSPHTSHEKTINNSTYKKGKDHISGDEPQSHTIESSHIVRRPLETYEYQPYKSNRKSVDFVNEVAVMYFTGDEIISKAMEPLKKELDQQIRNKEMRRGHIPCTLLNKKEVGVDDYMSAWFKK